MESVQGRGSVIKEEVAIRKLNLSRGGEWVVVVVVVKSQLFDWVRGKTGGQWRVKERK